MTIAWLYLVAAIRWRCRSRLAGVVRPAGMAGCRILCRSLTHARVTYGQVRLRLRLAVAQVYVIRTATPALAKTETVCKTGRRRIPVSCWLASHAAHLPGRTAPRASRRYDSLILASLSHVAVSVGAHPPLPRAITYTYCHCCCLLFTAMINLNLFSVNRQWLT